MLSSIRRKFLNTEKKEATSKQKKKLELIINKNIIQEYENQKKLKENKLINAHESLSINLVIDEISNKAMDIAEKLQLDCSCEVFNEYKDNNTTAYTEIRLIKQLSHFSFNKYAEYIKSQIEVPVNAESFVIDSLVDQKENKITISVIRI